MRECVFLCVSVCVSECVRVCVCVSVQTRARLIEKLSDAKLCMGAAAVKDFARYSCGDDAADTNRTPAPSPSTSTLTHSLTHAKTRVR